MYVYHPYQYGILPTADETDMLIVLGGPMSPNDDLDWIKQERVLIKQLLDAHKPIFGACYGAQQIAKTLGYAVHASPVKEVGWAPVTLQSQVIPGLPATSTVLHWHQEMFEIPDEAELLYSSKGLRNQGFVIEHEAIGLQFHFEPLADNVREMVVNDGAYTTGSILNETPQDILDTPVPADNEETVFKLLDYLNA
ncbi:hypothetical protein FC82_GL002964 [Secundilactobacillus collinoides DSM 20515 = JCM 1123]|uniref:Glutamine amidotransferase domain-containing protein n=2 Tax=Secundilactobacillus collinoides TaxID=33960 RepID=A0A0R2BP53_SECCO|nr:hypothetical protein FC82_GL002964 [Secundilactobacillus collinoides DSM 20515 = JCM 1123]